MAGDICNTSHTWRAIAKLVKAIAKSVKATPAIPASGFATFLLAYLVHTEPP